ncbi:MULTISPECIES: A24 family peptidase [Tabrizicola]|uniref:A24 family peptidase n=1 Tax=Tabrizicola TaxID=1443919 RepID=UPI0010822AAB|nr:MULTISPECIES: prepilin peptidase [Paracoccaceae]
MTAEGLLLSALALIVAASAISDLRHLRIPNTHVLVALGLFAVTAPFMLAWPELSPRLLAAGITFALCFALFALGVIGGGDAKMMPVIMLFVPAQDVVGFMQVFALALGAVSLGALAVQRVPFFQRLGWESARAQRHVPVGMAMAAAVIFLAVTSLVGA